MRSTLLFVGMLALGWISPLYAATIQGILGASVNCNLTSPACVNPIPLSLTALCTSACPKDASFSYTNSSRFWGVSTTTNACRTSTNGGGVWADCATQPFTPNIAHMIAGASDGSVIVAGTVAGPTCTIRRSIDNGANWTTVFTVGSDCGASPQEGDWLYCLPTGTCLYLAPGVISAGANQTFRSTNNGQNWTAGETSTNTWISVVGGAAWDGLNGIAANVNASTRSWTATADLWANSAVWGASSLVCNGPVIYNGTPADVCFNPVIPSYQLVNSAGTVLNTLTLPNATLNVSEGGTAFGFSSTVLYIAATKSRVPLPCGGGLCSVAIYMSQDNLVTFTSLGEFSVPVDGGMRAGNAFRANGCIYFSVGNAVTTNMAFAKVCV